MSIHWLKLQPEEPLLLGQVKADTNFLSSLTYIPGRIIRGAWAEWLIAQGRTSRIVPTVQPVQVGNFFPTMEWRSMHYVSPFLLSMLTCKRESGFCNEPNQAHRGHGVVDTLVPHLAYCLLKQAGARFPVPFTVTCPKCRGRMESESGFYTLFNTRKEQHYVRTREQYHAHTRVALSRFRRAANEGMLYSATAISPKIDRPDGAGRTDLSFVGRVSGPDDSVDELLIALQATAIGSMRTRGYGRIKATEIEMEVVPLSVRLKAFNDLLVALWQDLKRLATNAAVLPDRPDGCYFSLDLLAPAIFRNRGLPTLVPSLEVNDKTLQPVFWLTRPDFAAGWSDAWGLPKPTALAARMGSVYVFRWNGEQDVLMPALQQLEAAGVGERRDESFGECWICHPFHQEVSEQ